jgi:hypothetical protein
MKWARTYVVLFLIGMTFAAEASAEIEFIKVVEIKGRADVFDPVSSSWSAQTVTPIELKAGARLRTYADSTAEIVMDRKWERFIRLSEKSRISVLGADLGRLALDEGHLYILCEQDSKTVAPLKILTKDAIVELSVAGFGVSSDKIGSRIQVFADFVTVFPKKSGKYSLSGLQLHEGFQSLILAESDEASLSQRMSFDDYWKWQAWIKNRYATKDKLHTKRTSG